MKATKAPPGQTTEATQATESRTCPTCGLPQKLWSDTKGYRSDYCCRGCAEGGQCTCGQPVSSGTKGVKPDSARGRIESSQENE